MTRAARTTLYHCPNEPRCPHARVFHDVEDYDDPLPRCCAEGCDCGRKDRTGRAAVLSALMKTDILDRFNAWIGDPDTPQEPTLQDAFTEGFAQAMEWISGQPRERSADPQ